jgi:hypothetical protein
LISIPFCHKLPRQGAAGDVPMDVDWLVSCVIDEELFITNFFYPASSTTS